MKDYVEKLIERGDIVFSNYEEPVIGELKNAISRAEKCGATNFRLTHIPMERVGPPYTRVKFYKKLTPAEIKVEERKLIENQISEKEDEVSELKKLLI